MTEIRSQSMATMAIAASALKAQQGRMRVIAENIANANSTARTAGGDPYRRQVPVFKPAQVAGGEGVAMVGLLEPFPVAANRAGNQLSH